MGEVVEFRHDPLDAAYADRVRFLCWLVDRVDLADDLLRRGLPFVAICDELCIHTGRLDWGRRRMRRLIGPAGTRRRDLPKSPTLYRRP